MLIFFEYTSILREVAERDDIDVIVDPAEIALDEISRKEVESSPDRNRDLNLEILRDLAARGDRLVRIVDGVLA